MLKFFGSIKSTSLNVLNLILNISTLLYLTSLFGFKHINKELIVNSFTGITLVLLILTVFITITTFMLYVSFRLAYKKIEKHIETLMKSDNI